MNYSLTAAENMDFVLSDDFCRKHFLVGILLREVKKKRSIYILLFQILITLCTFKVECSLDFDAGSVRRKTLEILRNLIAKHDCDSRYADPVSSAHCVCVCVYM